MEDGDDELMRRARMRIGTTLKEKYRLDSILGVGGMAVVYRATHRNQAELAIKMLHVDLSTRDSLRKRFLREGYAANSVKHPGVVTIVDDDVSEDGSAFLVMELLRGAPVDALAIRSGGHLPVPIACAILDQVLDVLASAHEKGIVHRDIKPQNLFLQTDGTVKVLDFGIARVRDAMSGDTHATGTGVLLGTPAYMAPEQARGATNEIDARTDLWAAAATFFAIVSGQTVHAGDNPAQLLIAAATSFARSVATVANVAPPVARVIDRALSFRASDRYANAADMRKDLREATQGAFGAPPSRSLLAEDAIDIVSQRSIGAPTVAGVQTAQPVSTNTTQADRVQPSRKSLSVPVQILAGVVLAVAAVFIVKAIGRDTRGPADVPQSTTTTTASASASAAPPPSVSIAPIVTSSVPSATTPSKAHHASPQNACDPPYYFDSENRKIFKKECL